MKKQMLMIFLNFKECEEFTKFWCQKCWGLLCSKDLRTKLSRYFWELEIFCINVQEN